MTKYIFFQAFTETLNGVTKGSMNRFLAFAIGLTACFVFVYSSIKNQPVPDATLIEFFGFAAALLGLSAYAKGVDLKSTTPNPNLPNKTQP
jgi:hypothetical protein